MCDQWVPGQMQRSKEKDRVRNKKVTNIEKHLVVALGNGLVIRH
jgi:hypothetical protein